MRYVAMLIIFIGLSASTFASPVSRDAKSRGEFRDCPECPEMVVIPPGRFVMGSTNEETMRENQYPMVSAWEKPLREIEIRRPFAIGKYQVTVGEYASFVRATRHADGDRCYIYVVDTGKWSTAPGVTWRYPAFPQTVSEPVVCVNVADAEAYVHWLSKKAGRSYRVVSEAEWEYVARAASQTARPWGDGREGTCLHANVSDIARARAHTQLPPGAATIFDCDDHFVYTSPAGAFPPNAFGVYDMLGNTWSWTADCFNPSHEGRSEDGAARTTGDCKFHMIKGGSWGSTPADVRSAQRGRDPSEYRANYIGFRVVSEAP